MPSTTSSDVSMVLDSSTVMTPSLPTFFIAPAMMSPMCLSLFALMVPTWAIMSPLTSLCRRRTSSTATSTARSMPRFSAVGLAPAATAFTPSRKMAWASTVAVVVPSPATSEVLDATSRTICAPMFSSGSCSSISLATVTPALVMMGEPNFFSITALRRLGPSVILTASASGLTPRRIAWREFSPVTICFAMMSFSYFLCCELVLRCVAWAASGKLLFRLSELALAGCFGSGAELREDLVFLHDHEFLAVNGDVVAAVLAEQDAVTGFYVEGDEFTFFAAARADGDDFTLLWFLFSGVRDDDATLDGFLLFQAPH